MKIKKIPIGSEWQDRLLIALDDNGKILGHCRLWDNYRKLTELYISPGYRNGMVAEALLIEGATMAKVHGNKILIGYCKKRLLKFYKKYGALPTGEEKDGLYTVEYHIA